MALVQGSTAAAGNLWRLIKAGTKINFNLHLNPRGEETPVSVKLGLKVYPKGRVPKYVAFTQHMGDASISTYPLARSRGTTATSGCRSPRCWRRSSRTCTIAARRSASKRSIPTCVRFRPARPGPRRNDLVRQQLPIRLAHHVSIRRRRRAAASRRDDRSRHLVARQHGANKWNPNPKNWVGYGQRSIDEMSFAWVTLTYLEQDDFDQRVAARRAQK